MFDVFCLHCAISFFLFCKRGGFGSEVYCFYFLWWGDKKFVGFCGKTLQLSFLWPLLYFWCWRFKQKLRGSFCCTFVSLFDITGSCLWSGMEWLMSALRFISFANILALLQSWIFQLPQNLAGFFLQIIKRYWFAILCDIYFDNSQLLQLTLGWKACRKMQFTTRQSRLYIIASHCVAFYANNANNGEN